VTDKEKVEVYEKFFHQIQLHFSIVYGTLKVEEALRIIDDWSYAHRVGNGLSDEEQEKLVEVQFNRMKEFV